MRHADHVVFRVGTPDDAARVHDDRALAVMLRGRSASVLYPDTGEDGAHMGRVVLSGAEFELSLEQLRHADVLSVLVAGGALQRALADTHFILPSGHHSEEFVRLGDALRDPVLVGRLVDWILPTLDGSTVLLSDTGSIGALVERIRYEALRRLGWNIPHETIARYPVESDDLVEVIDDLLIGHPDRELLVLLSVNSTGGLLRRIVTLLDQAPRVVTVCHTGAESVEFEDAVATLEIERWPQDGRGDCERCADLQSILIDPATYVPRPGLRAERMAVDWRSVSAHGEFWAMVDQSEALELHKDVDHGDGRVRHLAIHVDFAQLLGLDAYFTRAQRKLVDVLQGDHQPTCVLIPRHHATDALSSLAAAALRECSWDSTEIEVLDGGYVNPDVLGDAKTPRIVILDDAVINGATANNLRRAIQNAGERLRRQPRVDFLALLARPEDQSTLRMLKQRRYRMSDGEHFHSLDTILFPSKGSCPWCAERRQWQKWSGRLSDQHGLVADRIAALQSGTPNPLLFGASGDLAPALGAAVGELSPATAFAAISCVVQQKRDEIRDRSRGDMLVFNDTRLTLDAYFDTVFLAAVLRTFDRRDLRWHEFDADVSDYIRNSLISEAQTRTEDALPDEYFVELALAAVTTRVPLPAVQELLSALTESPTIALVRELVEMHAPK